MDEWEDALRGGELLPTGGALAQVEAEVRRRRRRQARRRAVAVTATLATAATTAVVAVLALGGGDSGPAVAKDPSRAGLDADAADCLDRAVRWDEIWASQVAEGPDERLRAAAKDVERRTRGIEGNGGVEASRVTDSVIVRWKEPVPEQVRALADQKAGDGVPIEVVGVAYSPHELAVAANRMHRAFEDGEVTGRMTFSAQCINGMGVLVGITPETLGDRAPELGRKLTDLTGVRVVVVAQEQLPAPRIGDLDDLPDLPSGGPTGR